MFCRKNVTSFCKLLHCKSYSHFCSKNIIVFENTLATVVMEFVINKLVKLRMLYTTGHCTLQLAAQMALEKVCQAYTTARQEVSILQTVCHPHIVPLLGFSRRPLALLLALAPMGSLQDLLEKRHKEGLRLPVFVIKQVVIQVMKWFHSSR